ncbi:MAG: hypothetical protein COU51_04630 [Parcubacteria group bacterium CG10_big_fil_rev_8_21_14_0_10_36_14]|nr:MAG: hypothetical protein COU51_04630 [Parcubacteria group bacterium CG10_big_fil_rev_8_21_14_0_10_36_14]
MADSKKKYLWSLGEAVDVYNLQVERFNEETRRLQSESALKKQKQLIGMHEELYEQCQELQRRIWLEGKTARLSLPAPNPSAVMEQMQILRLTEGELLLNSGKVTLFLGSPE